MTGRPTVYLILLQVENGRKVEMSKMLSGKRRLIAGLAGVVAAVLFVEVDPMKWYHEQAAVYSVDKNELFDYITSPGEVKEVSKDEDKYSRNRI